MLNKQFLIILSKGKLYSTIVKEGARAAVGANAKVVVNTEASNGSGNMFALILSV